MRPTFYAHRGNLFGPKPELENTMEYIDQAIKFGFKVEVDVWLEDNNLYLGHDNPEQLITFDYLFSRTDDLLVHAKNVEAFIYLSSRTKLNVFFHTYEQVVMSSNGNLIFHPEHYPLVNVPPDAIFSMPEYGNIKLPSYRNVITDYAGTLWSYLQTKSEDDEELLPEILIYE